MIRFFLLFVLLSGQSLAEKILPMNRPDLQPPPVAVKPVDEHPECEFPGLNLPKNFVILGAGDYSGRKLNFQIDQSGHEATRMDVIVNSKDPVVLILGAYEPTVWNLGWTAKTKIVAILIGGYHAQKIVGISEKMPLLVTTYDNKHPCGYFYMGTHEIAKVNDLSKRLFGKAMDTVVKAEQGMITAGDKLAEKEPVLTSDWKTMDSVVDKNAPLAGEQGLDEAVRKGFIRKMNAEDSKNVSEAMRHQKEKGNTSKTKLVGFETNDRALYYHNMPNAYVVLKKFTYPAGLFGANAGLFVIPKGVPDPAGDSGHSTVLNFNKSPVCQGILCH